MYGSSRTIMNEVKKKVTAVVLTTAIGVTSVSALADFDKETSNTDVNDTNITEVTTTPEAVNEPTASPTIEPTASPTIEPTVSPTIKPTVIPTDDNSESTLTQNDDKAPFEDLNNNNPLNEYVSDDDFGISLFSGTSSSDSNSIPGTSDLYYSFEDGVLSIYGSGKVPANLSATWTNSKTVEFNPNEVTEIIIEEGITGINDRLTRSFKNAISVTLPNSLEYIGEKTFYCFTKLETVTIPDNSKLKYVYTSAFEKCTSLKSINLPKGLESIYSRAFISCSNLTNLTLPSTLKRIDELAFSDGPRFKNNELTVPKGVTTITSRSFDNIKDLKTINVENGVTTIEKYAFADNDSLTRVNLPSSITSVANTACKYYNEEKYSTCDIYIDKYKDSIPCYSNWGTTGTIYWKARDFKNTTDNTVVISDVADQTYTGSLIAPNITVSCNDVELVKDTDYTVSYSNNKNVGTATISITGIGDYTGTITKNFNIVARDISDTTIGSIPNQTYTGNSISVLPVITYNGATLTKGTDYTLTYSNNVNVGTGTVTITGKGNFKGTTSKTFSIVSKDISQVSFGTIANQSYTGSELTPLPTITYNGKSLTKDVDFKATYSNNVNKGTATVKVAGIGNFSGLKTFTFAISSRNMSDVSVAAIAAQKYTGNSLTPTVTATYNNKTLVANTDYTVSYSDNANAGTATITLSGKNNFTGTKNVTFTINPESISNTSVNTIPEQKYMGVAVTPIPAITYNGKTLSNNADYTLSYSNNNRVGTATVTITGKGNFTGTTSKNFTIKDFTPDSSNPISLNSDKLKINWDNTSYVYDGNEKKPKPTSIRYYFNDVYSYSLIEGQDFSLSYANNTDAGTGTVTVNGVGGFSNSKSNNFTITSASINNAVFTDIETAEFSGGKLYPNFTVTVDGRELVKNTDYTVEYSNNVQVGTGNIKITGKDNYTGVAETTFTIEPYDPQRHDKDPVDMSTLHLTITGTFTYNKAEQKPVPTIVYQKYNNETSTMLEYTLVEGKDYNLTYTNNINAGTATLTATGIGVFKGSKNVEFTINPKSAESLSIDTIGDKVFSGVAQTPDAVIKDVD